MQSRAPRRTATVVTYALHNNWVAPVVRVQEGLWLHRVQQRRQQVAGRHLWRVAVLRELHELHEGLGARVFRDTAVRGRPRRLRSPAHGAAGTHRVHAACGGGARHVCCHRGDRACGACGAGDGTAARAGVQYVCGHASWDGPRRRRATTRVREHLAVLAGDAGVAGSADTEAAHAAGGTDTGSPSPSPSPNTSASTNTSSSASRGASVAADSGGADDASAGHAAGHGAGTRGGYEREGLLQRRAPHGCVATGAGDAPPPALAHRRALGGGSPGRWLGAATGSSANTPGTIGDGAAAGAVRALGSCAPLP